MPQSGLFYLPRGQPAGPGEARPAAWALPGAGGPVNWSLQARAPPVQAAGFLAGMRLPRASENAASGNAINTQRNTI